MLIGTLDIGVQKFIVLNNDESENYSIFGAGITETTIGFWGYIVLSVIMIVSVFKAIKEFKKGRTKKVIGSILVVPGYLVSLLLVMLGFNLIFVNSNELDKEKKYIENNINSSVAIARIFIFHLIIKSTNAGNNDLFSTKGNFSLSLCLV